jgi:hypothetical protein
MARDGKPHDRIDYEALQQEALRGVVRAALKQAAATGLPGDHHFYITFKTGAPGVTGPKELLDQYPDEMMIVLQLQFWDLAPGDAAFGVTLRFGGQPKALTIPYAAITQFWDPSVDYRLRFHVPEPPPSPAALAPAPASSPAQGLASKPAKPGQPPDKDAEAPNIVSLDQFRKK